MREGLQIQDVHLLFTITLPTEGTGTHTSQTGMPEALKGKEICPRSHSGKSQDVNPELSPRPTPHGGFVKESITSDTSTVGGTHGPLKRLVMGPSSEGKRRSWMGSWNVRAGRAKAFETLRREEEGEPSAGAGLGAGTREPWRSAHRRAPLGLPWWHSG